MKYAYIIANGRYIQELTLNDEDEVPEGAYVSAESVDCTKYKPDENGNPGLIIIIPPVDPPVIPLTKAQKIALLNAEYDPKFLSLQMAYSAAGLADNGALNIAQKQDSLTQQNLNLLAEKKAKVTVIING
jgi:hypothetical protein